MTSPAAAPSAMLGHRLHHPGPNVGPPLPAGAGDVFAQPVLVPHLRPKLLDLGGEQSRPLAVLDLAQPLMGLHGQLEHLGKRIDGVARPLQVARHDPRDGHLGEPIGDGECLPASQIGERDIGLPYESSLLVPLGFPVPDEEQRDIVIHHSSDGTHGRLSPPPSPPWENPGEEREPICLLSTPLRTDEIDCRPGLT